jgi:CO dehydrogenase/acetyl-CoA synthase epsilon subunit
MGIPEYEAKRYEGKIKEGGILISVHADDSDEIDRAKKIFQQHNAQDIATASEAKAPLGRKRDQARPGTAESDETTVESTRYTPPPC